MLKFFERNSSCDIILEPPLNANDFESMKNLFEKNYIYWNITFGRIYTVDTKIVKLLYKKILLDKKNVKITTHKYRLNRYLHQLGFSPHFDSLIQHDVVNVGDIKVFMIGGSADSSTKILEIVKNINLENLSLIVVQHVEADKEGIFDKILQGKTKYKVSYVVDGEAIKKGRIYLAMRDKHLEVKDDKFVLSDEVKYNNARPSISLSYESFSKYYKEKLLVLQECGYVNDGVDKLGLMRKNNTVILLQDSAECTAKSMVEKALQVDEHHYILDIKNIIIFLKIITIDKRLIIEYLKEMIFKIYGYDFRLYNKEMFQRRLEIFILKHNIKHIKDAVSLILFNKSAFKGFFLEISINVTELFRKPKSFKNMLKFISKNYKKNYHTKVWSAGCSSGEEPYSMAIILDILGMYDKATIYATDFNKVIIQEAKNAIYSNEVYSLAKENFKQIGLKGSIDDYVEKYEKFIQINEKIRNKINFFQHNLASDGSFNEFDIIICKNVIIYFDADLQEKVFELLYDSLKFGGHLVLGEREIMNRKFISRFEQCEKDCMIFKKVG